MADLTRLNNIKSGKIFRLFDIPIFAVLIAVTVALLLTAFMQETGSKVRVTIDGEVVAVYSLDNDITTELKSADGKYILILNIKDGKAFVTEPTCPDHVCKNTGKINRVHQTIYCLPAGIVIRIVGESDIDGIGGRG